jgi:hypothetical protein
MKETVNAVIDSTFLGIEDHDALTVSIFLKYGDSVCQGFGGYCLGDALGKTSWAGYFIRRLLEVCGVRSWRRLEGCAIRAVRETCNNGKILGIGHIIKDDWFYPEDDYKKGWPSKEDTDSGN